jgi:hypothetical protein
MRSLPVWIAAAWVMSLSTLGFFVVPMLFAYLPTPAMAGTMAAKLFSVQTGVSTACGLALLLWFRSKWAAAIEDIAPVATVYIAGGVLLALLVEFGVAPRIVARDNLALWHRVGSVMYVLQWLCALVVFKKMVQALRTSGLKEEGASPHP